MNWVCLHCTVAVSHLHLSIKSINFVRKSSSFSKCFRFCTLEGNLVLNNNLSFVYNLWGKIIKIFCLCYKFWFSNPFIFATQCRLTLDTSNQCFGSGSVWIRIIWSDPDPYQETIDMDPGSVKNYPKPWNK